MPHDIRLKQVNPIWSYVKKDWYGFSFVILVGSLQGELGLLP
jgi:hypothetical protein